MDNRILLVVDGTTLSILLRQINHKLHYGKLRQAAKLAVQRGVGNSRGRMLKRSHYFASALYVSQTLQGFFYSLEGQGYVVHHSPEPAITSKTLIDFVCQSLDDFDSLVLLSPNSEYWGMLDQLEKMGKTTTLVVFAKTHASWQDVAGDCYTLEELDEDFGPLLVPKKTPPVA